MSATVSGWQVVSAPPPIRGAYSLERTGGREHDELCRNHMTRQGWLAVASATLLLACVTPAAGGARSVWTIECQHPIVTGVEINGLRHISIARACPVALAFFRWEIDGRHRLSLYRCHELGQRHPHPHLRLHDFRGWRLSLTPEFVMSRHGASFALAGNDFPIDCP